MKLIIEFSEDLYHYINSGQFNGRLDRRFDYESRFAIRDGKPIDDVTDTNDGDLISRQAAIDALMELLDRPNHAEFLYTDEICRALNHLPSVEPEKCGDCVNRQAVLEIQAKYAEHIGATKFWQMRDDIRALPPVTPQPKIGKWILKRTSPTRLYDEHIREYECSECYRGIRCTESQLINYPYCHCGAKMIESQKSEDKE